MEVAVAFIKELSKSTLIYADDKRLNYLSYKYLWLRCYFCNETIIYRHGEINVPHFAHLPDVHPDKMEECELRQKNLGNIYLWSSLSTPGRNQRLKIFHKYFLWMITDQLSDFFYKSDFTLISEKTPLHKRDKLQPFIEDSIEEFRGQVGNIAAYYCLPQFRTSEITLLHRTIATEAIEYLCLSSSKSLLKKLIYYVIDKIQSNKARLSFKPQECKKISRCIANLIIEARWEKAFCSVSNDVYREPNEVEKEIYKILENGCIYIQDKSLIFIRESDEYKIEKIILGKFLAQPNFQDKAKYPHHINFHIINNHLFETHKDNFKIFQNRILNSINSNKQTHPQPIPVSKKQKITWTDDKKQIRVGKAVLALVEMEYKWYAKNKLQLKDFFIPTLFYSIFLDSCPNEQESLTQIFDDWLNSFNIKIPFSTEEVL